MCIFWFLWCLEVFVCFLGSMHMDFPIPLVVLMYLHQYQFSIWFYGASDVALITGVGFLFYMCVCTNIFPMFWLTTCIFPL